MKKIKQNVDNNYSYHPELLKFREENRKNIKNTEECYQNFVTNLEKTELKIWNYEVSENIIIEQIISWKFLIVNFWRSKLESFMEINFFDDEMYSVAKKFIKEDSSNFTFYEWIKDENNWLDIYCSSKKKFEVKWNISQNLFCMKENFLSGELDLTKFINLRNLLIRNSIELERIILPNKSLFLSRIDVSNNGLFSLDFLWNGDYPNLEFIFSANNFHEAYNIEKFSKFTKLKAIMIENGNFFGSLRSWKDLKNLQLIDITNTNIKDGLQELPSSVKYVHCRVERIRIDGIDYSRESVKIADEMKYYENDYQQWKSENIQNIIYV